MARMLSVAGPLLLYVLGAARCDAAQLGSGLWTVKGRHSRELVATLGEIHQDGDGYSRFKNSFVVEVQEEALLEVLQEERLLAVPIPKPLGPGESDENRKVVECSFLLESVAVASSEYVAGLNNIFTFRGRAVAGEEVVCSGAQAAIDYNPYSGFHGMVTTMDLGTVFIDPYTRDQRDLYNVYWRKENVDAGSNEAKGVSQRSKEDGTAAVPWSCGVTVEMQDNAKVESSQQAVSLLRQRQQRRLQAKSDIPLRTLRAAIAGSAEYLKYFDNDVDKAAAAVLTTMNRVSEVFRRDFGIEFTVVGNRAALFDTGLSNNDNAKLELVHTNIQRAMGGDSTFDIGHFFHTLDNGLALVASVCQTGMKGRGASGAPDPTVDAFHVDYVSHEIGHQMGASHTMMGAVCGKFDPNTSVEPGSGSTIMGYAGICQDDNLQDNTDDYFHTLSVMQIETTMALRPAGMCGTAAESLPRPTVKVASETFAIPVGTPFELAVEGADEAAHSYTWEQMNAPVAERLLSDTDVFEGRFRSYQPRASAARRWFPSREVLFATGQDSDLADPDGDIVSVARITLKKARLAEQLPSQPNEVMEFAVTARTLSPTTQRGTGSDVVTITVADVGPFKLSSSSSASLEPNGTLAVRWDVNGADSLSPQVEVMLSLDNGLSFETLDTGVPNQGAFDYPVPSTVCDSGATQARVMVASLPEDPSAGSFHRFFAVSEDPIVVCGSGEDSLLLFSLAGVGAALVVAVGVFAAVRRRRSGAVEARLPLVQRDFKQPGRFRAGPPEKSQSIMGRIASSRLLATPYARAASQDPYALESGGYESSNPLFGRKERSPPSAFASSAPNPFEVESGGFQSSNPLFGRKEPAAPGASAGHHGRVREQRAKPPLPPRKKKDDHAGGHRRPRQGRGHGAHHDERTRRGPKQHQHRADHRERKHPPRGERMNDVRDRPQEEHRDRRGDRHQRRQHKHSPRGKEHAEKHMEKLHISL